MGTLLAPYLLIYLHMNKVILLLLYLFIGHLSCAEEFPSLIDCKESACEDFPILKPIEISFNFIDDDCYNCDESTFHFNEKETSDSHLTAEIKQLIQVGFLTEVLAQSQSQRDKRMHIRSGSYIGYFSSQACKSGPELLQLNIRINKTGQFFCALAGATVAGIAKELYDSTDRENHTVDAKDAFATSLGAFANIPLYKISF